MTIVQRSRLYGTALAPSHSRKFLEALPLHLDMLDAADVSGGDTTQTVGFQVKNKIGEPIKYKLKLQFAAFDDIGLATPATNATLDVHATPAKDKGTILGGPGSPALKVESDDQGRFEVEVTDLEDETVYFACSQDFGTPDIDCSEIDSVTFSP